MTNQPKIKNLVRSIQSMNQFVENVHLLGSGQEFIRIYDSVMAGVAEVAKERKSEMLTAKLNEMPPFNLEQMDEYIREKSGENYAFVRFFGIIPGIIRAISSRIKSKGKPVSRTTNDLEEMKRINTILVELLTRPDLEALLTLKDSKK